MADPDREILEIQLTDMAYGGEAMGRDPAGRMVFVPFTLPGERVRVELYHSRKGWGRGRLLEVLEPSPLRMEPRCVHFGECGGCAYQHIPYEEQTRIKRDIVEDQLQRIGGFTDPPLSETIASPDPWYTRTRMQFQLTGQGELGFNYTRTLLESGMAPQRVFPLQECHLPVEAINQTWPLLTFEGIPDLHKVSIRSGNDGQRMIILRGEGLPDFELTAEVAASIVWISPEEISVLSGDDHLWFQVKDQPFRVSAGSFFQVHAQLTEVLVDEVLGALSVEPGRMYYDLYAGVGLFSRFIAQSGGEVVAVEESPWAWEDFSINLEPFPEVSLYQASVEEALPHIPGIPDAVILDPPRSGLVPEVIDRLGKLSPKRLVYVSCDPATMARDAKRLSASGFQLERVTPIDLFPQTFHIETLSQWRFSAGGDQG